ncbi:hypothetical protein NUW54_g5385 [Trametes sanguinea]|uniref:Uncharacterized protein n=1 Tax=Trametes sanguinea TaxID=158606 RepID=A0ACC1PWT6_9APHY|nr:hypothetical protein NUW54_g5385 [Trametes sanguinea]
MLITRGRWNASRAFASYLDDHPELYQGGSVLELGAGGALPGIVAAKNGARTVVLTDYPDAALIDNILHNVRANIPEGDRGGVHVEGYIWGHPVEPLLRFLPDDVEEKAFDLIILSDLIFNHSQHDAMLKSCDVALSQRRGTDGTDASGKKSPSAPCLLVFYTHHRPHLAHRDMAFFTKAQERGWHCEEILTRKYPPMFPEDPGEEEVRATVHVQCAQAEPALTSSCTKQPHSNTSHLAKYTARKTYQPELRDFRDMPLLRQIQPGDVLGVDELRLHGPVLYRRAK